MGWADLSNGKLLQRACQNGFQVFLTVDQNIRYQQNLQHHPIAIVVLIADGITIADLRPLVAKVNEVLLTVQPGNVYEVMTD